MTTVAPNIQDNASLKGSQTSKQSMTVTQDQLQKCLSKENSVVSNTGTKRPILKITINKKYNNVNRTVHPRHSKEQCLSNGDNKTNNQTHVNIREGKCNSVNVSQTNPTRLAKHNIRDLSPTVLATEIRNDVMSKMENDVSRKTYVRRRYLSGDNMYTYSCNHTLRYLYTKAQRDCDILKKRLQALKERHKQEQKEVRKLQIYLRTVKCKDLMIPPDTKFEDERRLVIENDSEAEDELKKWLKEVTELKKNIPNLLPKELSFKRKRRVSYDDLINDLQSPDTCENSNDMFKDDSDESRKDCGSDES